jgi:hypothetical protein
MAATASPSANAPPNSGPKKPQRRIFCGNQILPSVFLSIGRESVCVIENFAKRDVAMFVLAFAIAGCLMIWTINLSIDRLLYADGDQRTAAPAKREVRFPQPDPPVCTASPIGQAIPQSTTLHVSAAAPAPCHTAELEPAPSIDLR